MKYLLDTNICIYFFRGKYNMKERINTVGIENCAISEITLAELVYGAEHSSNSKKIIGATAIANRLTMVTQNTKEFERLEGIELENWVNE